MTMEHGGTTGVVGLSQDLFRGGTVLEPEAQTANSREEKGFQSGKSWKQGDGVSTGGNVKQLLTEASDLRLGQKVRKRTDGPLRY